MINKTHATTLQNLAAIATKPETSVSDLLNKLEVLRAEIQESAKAELLAAAAEWAAKVPSWDTLIHPDAERCIIGKADNVRFSKSVMTPEQGAAIRQAKKQSPKDLLLVLQTGKAYRTYTVAKDPGSPDSFLALMPSMDDAALKTFQEAKDRYTILKTGASMPWEAETVTFLD